MSITSAEEYARYAEARDHEMHEQHEAMVGMWLSEITNLIKATDRFIDRTGNLRNSIGTGSMIKAAGMVYEILVAIGMEYASYVEALVHFVEPVLENEGPGIMDRLFEEAAAGMTRWDAQYVA